MIDHKKIGEVLLRIQNSIPPNYSKNLFKKQKMTPEAEFVFKKALEEPSISKEKKEQIKAILESGDLSKEEMVENETIKNKINKFVDKAIDKEIKLGNLPTREELKKYYEDKKTKA